MPDPNAQRLWENAMNRRRAAMGDVKFYDEPCIECGGLATVRYSRMVNPDDVTFWCDDCFDYWYLATDVDVWLDGLMPAARHITHVAQVIVPTAWGGFRKSLPEWYQEEKAALERDQSLNGWPA